MDAFEIGFFAIPVENMELAKKFYGAVMGWEFAPGRDETFCYALANGNMIGSIELASEKLVPAAVGPLMYFRADVMSKVLARVEDNLGRVVYAEAVNGGERGYVAKVLDPSFNAIGFWAPEE